nr:MAG TPA: hypothetical protein [Caudoviricetes sp.]
MGSDITRASAQVHQAHPRPHPRSRGRPPYPIMGGREIFRISDSCQLLLTHCFRDPAPRRSGRPINYAVDL